MSALLLDSSVWLAAARSAKEPDHTAASTILGRRVRRDVELRLLDLTVYEIGHVLVRKWQGSAKRAEQLILQALELATVPPLVPSAAERGDALELAEQHDLSVYDASYAAVARARRLTLVSGDRQLVETGLAVAPADV